MKEVISSTLGEHCNLPNDDAQNICLEALNVFKHKYMSVEFMLIVLYQYLSLYKNRNDKSRNKR